MSLTEEHTASKWPSQDLNLRSYRSHVLNQYAILFVIVIEIA